MASGAVAKLAFDGALSHAETFGVERRGAIMPGTTTKLGFDRVEEPATTTESRVARLTNEIDCPNVAVAHF